MPTITSVIQHQQGAAVKRKFSWIEKCNRRNPVLIPYPVFRIAVLLLANAACDSNGRK